MVKKLLTILLAISIVGGFGACGQPQADVPKEPSSSMTLTLDDTNVKTNKNGDFTLSGTYTGPADAEFWISNSKIEEWSTSDTGAFFLSLHVEETFDVEAKAIVKSGNDSTEVAFSIDNSEYRKSKLDSSSSTPTTPQRETSKEITEDQMRMLQATTQIALKDNGFEDDTSPQLQDWSFAANAGKGTQLWNVVTNTNGLGRVKVIWAWSGDNKDDLLLAYMLVGGEEIYNKLNDYR